MPLERPEPGRTPAELCKEALVMANQGQSQLPLLRAITVAIVGLAGEVNQLGKQSVNLRADTIVTDVIMVGEAFSLEGLIEDDDFPQDDEA
jgi:hypothetical protein